MRLGERPVEGRMGYASPMSTMPGMTGVAMQPTAAAEPVFGTRGALLAEQVLACRPLLARYLAGFTDVTAVRQTPDLPNHVAWNLGHCALTMHRVAAMVDGLTALPAGDFVTGDGTAGSRDRGVFDTEAVCFGSRPEDRYDRFPTLARATEVYNAACERLAAALRPLPDAELDRVVRFGSGEMPLWLLVTRMVFHNGFHTGQISDLRRALGFRSIFA